MIYCNPLGLLKRFIYKTLISAIFFMAINAHINYAAKLEWKPEDTWRKKGKNQTANYIKQAEFHEKYKDYKKAIKYYKKIERKSVNLRNKAKATIAHGRCFEKMEDPWNAYLQYKKAIDDYANYIPFVDILDKEFVIANIFNDGKKDKFLFFSFSTYGKAIEIYDHIAQSGPYAEITPLAIYKSGLLSLEIKDYEEAASKFTEVITRYPRSKYVADSRIEIAKCLLKNAAQADGDGSLMRQAHKQLTLFFRYHKEHPRKDEAQILLDQTLSLEGKRLLYLGEFYMSQAHRRTDACKRYLRQVVTDYGETESARLAEKLLAIIETK